MIDYVLLALAWALLRYPFLGNFDLVSYDGTFYITQAREILAGHPGAGGAFPPGYPIAVALFHAAFHDGVRAAQAVSLLASLAATGLLYHLARQVLPRPVAIACALAYAVDPLAARLSLSTMSESLYVAWVLAAMLARARGRRAAAGLLLGAAAVTRPEALGIAVAVAGYDVWRRRRPAETVVMLACFTAVYSLNWIVPAAGGAAVELVPKASQLGLGVRTAGQPLSAGSLLEQYALRLPIDLALLFRYSAGLAFVLAVVGIVRRPGFVLAALVPLAVNPLFTVRSEPRFIAPFVPFVLLYAFVGASTLHGPRARRFMIVLLAAFAVAGVAVNSTTVRRAPSPDVETARRAGLRLAGHIEPGARIADRKPFLAFYAGARYTEIPPGDYDATLDTLPALGVDYLALSTGVTDFFRPSLAPLLYDAAAVRGETRLRQVYVDPAGTSVFEVIPAPKRPAARTLYAAAAGLSLDAARWSARGDSVVFAANAPGTGMILQIPAGGAFRPDTLLRAPARLTAASPSPDGCCLALVSTASGSPDIVIYNRTTGAMETLFRSAAREMEPAWDGPDALLFTSEVGRHVTVHRVELGQRAAARPELPGDRARRARVSPDGSWLAWTEDGYVHAAPRGETGRRVTRVHPVDSAPSWSPRGRYLVFSARQSGSDDVYIADVESGRAVRITTDGQSDERAPDWHPAGAGIVFTVDGSRIMAIDDAGAWLQRLEGDTAARVHDRTPR